MANPLKYSCQDDSVDRAGLLGYSPCGHQTGWTRLKQLSTATTACLLVYTPPIYEGLTNIIDWN